MFRLIVVIYSIMTGCLVSQIGQCLAETPFNLVHPGHSQISTIFSCLAWLSAGRAAKQSSHWTLAFPLRKVQDPHCQNDTSSSSSMASAFYKIKLVQGNIKTLYLLLWTGTITNRTLATVALILNSTNRTAPELIWNQQAL